MTCVFQKYSMYIYIYIYIHIYTYIYIKNKRKKRLYIYIYIVIIVNIIINPYELLVIFFIKMTSNVKVNNRHHKLTPIFQLFLDHTKIYIFDYDFGGIHYASICVYI